ncbi:unnamed protein product [Effrenium voratum]|nr:unnamed protein product [Effrenium voratum]
MLEELLAEMRTAATRWTMMMGTNGTMFHRTLLFAGAPPQRMRSRKARRDRSRLFAPQSWSWRSGSSPAVRVLQRATRFWRGDRARTDGRKARSWLSRLPLPTCQSPVSAMVKLWQRSGAFPTVRSQKDKATWRKWPVDSLKTVVRAAAAAFGLRLVIAEKPRVAEQIASAAGLKKVGNYFKGKDMLVASACGHLVEFEDVGFNLTLPIFPHFHLKAVKGQAARLEVIRKLALKAQILVNACDAGREGELIFRRIRSLLHLEKMPFKRMWLQSLTPSAIQSELSNLREGQEYDHLAEAADCRARWDWLVGINGTRSMRQGQWLQAGFSVGRVMTPTLRLVAEREKAIQAFVPEPYQLVRATFCTSKDEVEAASYEGMLSTLNQEDILDWHEMAKKWKPGRAAKIVKEVSTVVEEQPPPLLSLADLQRACARQFKLSPSKTLSCAQRLYEEGLITYPRSDSRYLPEDHVAVVKQIISAAKPVDKSFAGKDLLFTAAMRVTKVGAKVFDNAKVSDHYAIIPMEKGLKQALTKRSTSQDNKVLAYIAHHFIAAFLPSAKYTCIHRSTKVGDYIFTTNSKVLHEAGYKAVHGYAAASPISTVKLAKGTKVCLKKALQVEDKETTPPSRYTQATLLTAMENCGHTVEDVELQSAMSAGIGTSSTRASIIDKLLLQKWVVEVGGGELQPSEQAVDLVQKLQNPGMRLLSLQQTGEWELHLRKIEEGVESADRANLKIQEAVALMVRSTRLTPSMGKIPAWKKLPPAVGLKKSKLKQVKKTKKAATPRKKVIQA